MTIKGITEKEGRRHYTGLAMLFLRGCYNSSSPASSAGQAVMVVYLTNMFIVFNGISEHFGLIFELTITNTNIQQIRS